MRSLAVRIVLATLISVIALHLTPDSVLGSCEAGDDLLAAHQVARAQDAYLAAADDPASQDCAAEGLEQVADALGRARAHLERGQSFLKLASRAEDDALAAEHRARAEREFIAALSVDAGFAEAAAALDALGPPSAPPDRWVKSNGWVGVLLTPVGWLQDLWNAWNVPWRKLGEMLAVALLIFVIVVAVLGRFWSWLFWSRGVVWLRSRKTSRHPPDSGGGRDVAKMLLTIEPFEPTSATDTPGKSMAELIGAALAHFSIAGGGRAPHLIKGETGVSPLPSEIADVSSHTKVVAALLRIQRDVLLNPERLVLSGTLQHSRRLGAGIALTLSSRGNVIDGVTLWQREFDPSYRSSAGNDVADESDKGVFGFLLLAEVAAVWTRFRSDPDSRRKRLPVGHIPFALLGTSLWQSYAAFRVGVKFRESGDTENARKCFATALIHDDRNYGAMLNLASIESEAGDFEQAEARLRRVIERLDIPANRDAATPLRNPAWYRAAYMLGAIHIYRFLESWRQDARPHHRVCDKCCTRFKSICSGGTAFPTEQAENCDLCASYALFEQMTRYADGLNGPFIEHQTQPESRRRWKPSKKTQNEHGTSQRGLIRGPDMVGSLGQSLEDRALADFLHWFQPLAHGTFAGILMIQGNWQMAKYIISIAEQKRDYYRMRYDIVCYDATAGEILQHGGISVCSRRRAKRDSAGANKHFKKALRDLDIALDDGGSLVSWAKRDPSLEGLRTATDLYTRDDGVQTTVRQEFYAILQRHQAAESLATLTTIGESGATTLRARNIVTPSALIRNTNLLDDLHQLAKDLKLPPATILRWRYLVLLSEIDGLELSMVNLLDAVDVRSREDLAKQKADTLHAALSRELAEQGSRASIPGKRVIDEWIASAKSATNTAAR